MREPAHVPPGKDDPLATAVKRGRGKDDPLATAVKRGRTGFGAAGARALRLKACLGAILLLGACGGKPTDLVLRGGVPAMTNLHEASSLPAESVRTVARRDYGWRLIYHPDRAPGDAEQGAARALCGLERRRPARIDHIPRLDPYADPGARIIDIHCA